MSKSRKNYILTLIWHAYVIQAAYLQNINYIVSGKFQNVNYYILKK